MPMMPAARPQASDTLQASAPAFDAHRLCRASARGGIGAFVTCAALAASALAAGAAHAGEANAPPPKVTTAFAATGTEQSLSVPAGVTSVHVSAIGQAGEEGSGNGFATSRAAGGDGAAVSAELPVTPGEILYVNVGANGFNGGGSPGRGSGAGGDASDVRTIPRAASETLESRLLVAAGGGGGGGVWRFGGGGTGGDAGGRGGEGLFGEASFGEGTNSSSGGGAGTLTGGGAGGSRCAGGGPWSGGDGSLGSGGFGAFDGWNPETGGGGGGGGYWGGGGGEGQCFFSNAIGGAGGGGGGGSSYLADGARSGSFGLASPATPASVTITYKTPATATPDTSTIAFPGVQPLSSVSAPQTITLTNNGGNPLAVGAASFAGSEPVLLSDHPEDFLLGSSGCLVAVAFEANCQIHVRFAPQGTGPRTATLQIEGNMAEGPTVIALSGTGGVLPQGVQGESGAAGAPGSGATGAAGPAGKAGLPGARGARGLMASYVCHRRRLNGRFVRACFVYVPAAPTAAVKATLRRGRTVYASGSSSGARATGGLLLEAGRKVPAGRYTLLLVSRRGLSRHAVTVK
jgi:hypothetical protein